MKRAKHIDNVDRKTLTVRMLSPTYWDLALIAKEQNRSINGQIMQFVLEGMARYLGKKDGIEAARKIIGDYAGVARYPDDNTSISADEPKK